MASPKETAEAEVAAAAPADATALEEGQVSEGSSDERDSSPDQSPPDAADNDAESSTSPKAEGPPESASDAPPLPAGPPPGSEPADDGWSAEWDAARSAWYFYNRFTGVSQWDNPRVPEASAAQAASTTAPGTGASSTSEPTSVAGGYNPAIHGSWDPNAPYAQAYTQPEEEADDGVEQLPDPTLLQVPGAHFNKRTGKFQMADQGPDRHNDEAKSYRQMNNFFDVDKAANSHDGRSLKAERQGKKPTKKELSMWKEKRKARKEEKRRAWLRD